MKDQITKKQKVIDFAKKVYEKGDFNYHILAVVNNSLMLAKKLKADQEVVEISAYLHDITRSYNRENIHEFVKDNDHHITGAKEAVEILREIGMMRNLLRKLSIVS